MIVQITNSLTNALITNTSLILELYFSLFAYAWPATTNLH
jgi:hypothetical protein